MLSYFIIFIIPMIFAWSASSKQRQQNKNLMSSILIVLFFTVAIGFRHEVGGDWGTYLRHFNVMSYLTFTEVIFRPDPGYYLIN
jgi:hypothetical protein